MATIGRGFREEQGVLDAGGFLRRTARGRTWEPGAGAAWRVPGEGVVVLGRPASALGEPGSRQGLGYLGALPPK